MRGYCSPQNTYEWLKQESDLNGRHIVKRHNAYSLLYIFHSSGNSLLYYSNIAMHFYLSLKAAVTQNASINCTNARSLHEQNGKIAMFYFRCWIQALVYLGYI